MSAYPLIRYGCVHQRSRRIRPGSSIRPSIRISKVCFIEQSFTTAHCAEHLGRTDLKELHTVTNLLLQHYGRDYVLRCMDNVDNCVPARVTSKLNTKTPETSVCENRPTGVIVADQLRCTVN